MVCPYFSTKQLIRCLTPKLMQNLSRNLGFCASETYFYKLSRASACTMYSTNLVPCRVVCRVFLQKFRTVVKLPFPIFQHLQRPLQTQFCFLELQINCALAMLILLSGGIQLSRNWFSLSYTTSANCFPTNPKSYPNYFLFFGQTTSSVGSLGYEKASPNQLMPDFKKLLETYIF